MSDIESVIRAIVREEQRPLEQKVEALEKTRAGASQPDLLNTKEAARLVGREPKTIRAWVDAGLLRDHGGKGRILISREELLAVAARPRRGKPPPPSLVTVESEVARLLGKAH